MKILHVGDIAFVGSKLCAELQNRGHQAELIAKKKFRHGATEGEDHIQYMKNFWDGLTLCGKHLDLYDIVHVHYLINWSALGAKTKAKTHNLLLHAHGDDTRPRNFIEKSIQQSVASSSSELLCSTPDLLNNVHWFKGEISYLPNPVSVGKVKRQNNQYKNRILIYTTLYKVKETEKLFPIISEMPLTFDIIASGPDLKYYRSAAPGNINFIKPFDRSCLFEELLRYPLILGGSQDGVIRVCELEAMALGVPTLFPFRYNEHYRQALPMAEVNAENILKYMGDDDFGEQQKQWVKKFHAVEVVVDQLLPIYERFLNKTRRFDEREKLLCS